jgi:hypothetical protein
METKAFVVGGRGWRRNCLSPRPGLGASSSRAPSRQDSRRVPQGPSARRAEGASPQERHGGEDRRAQNVRPGQREPGRPHAGAPHPEHRLPSPRSARSSPRSRGGWKASSSSAVRSAPRRGHRAVATDRPGSRRPGRRHAGASTGRACSEQGGRVASDGDLEAAPTARARRPPARSSAPLASDHPAVGDEDLPVPDHRLDPVPAVGIGASRSSGRCRCGRPPRCGTSCRGRCSLPPMIRDALPERCGREPPAEGRSGARSLSPGARREVVGVVLADRRRRSVLLSRRAVADDCRVGVLPGVGMSGVFVHVFVAGSYSSNHGTATPPWSPPA